MNISIFEVAGPVMIGPSSSHTAGAARLARIARLIVEKPFKHVSFGLHGSFADTYKGHGTDKALVAGALGLYEYDEALSHSFELAEKQNISFDFYKTELEDMHENSVKITFTLEDDSKFSVCGSSIGGGQIVIKKINTFETEFDARSSTLIVNQYDKKGVVNDITTVLRDFDINIGIMKLSRTAKGERACCIIETDSFISKEVVEKIRKSANIISVQAINL